LSNTYSSNYIDASCLSLRLSLSVVFRRLSKDDESRRSMDTIDPIQATLHFMTYDLNKEN